MSRKLVAEIIGDSSSFERSMARSRAATSHFGRDLSRESRGIVAASGLFKGLGRSVAFASAGFLGAAGLTSVLRSSIDEAQKSERAQASLSTAITKIGGNAKAALPAIDAWAQGQAKFGVSAAQAETSLARLIILTGSSRKAQLAYTAALEISKATGKDLNVVTLAAGKAFAGQTTALARYIGHIKKGLTAGELFNRIQAKFGGQAEANTLASDRFRATLANTEEIIGVGILPTVNKYLASLTQWLDKMNRSGKLQKDVNTAVHDFTTVLGGAIGFVKGIDRVTGSFKNTLELLIGAMAFSKVLKFAAALKEVGLASAIGLGGTAGGRGGLLGLLSAARALAKIGVVSIAFRFPGLAAGLSAIVGASAGEVGAVAAPALPFAAAIINDRGTHVVGDIPNTNKRIVQSGGRFFIENRPGGRAGGAGAQKQEISAAQASSLLGRNLRKPGTFTSHLTSTADFVPQPAPGKSTAPATKHGISLTTAQSNTFFDNRISRQISRAANETLPQQLKDYDKVLAELQMRLAKTKDITRRLNLEDQILSVEAQKAGVRAQLHQKFLDGLQGKTDRANFGVSVAQTTASFQDDIKALIGLQAAIKAQIAAEGHTVALDQQLFDARQQLAAARTSAITGRQFTALGLSPTGDTKVPGVTALKKSLGNVTDQVAGTILDTPKVEGMLKRIRKVLSGGLGEVGSDVRTKIAGILSNLESQLNQSTDKNIVKWKHLSSAAFLAGIPNLTAAQKRQLAARFDQVGPGGTIPGQSSAAFSKAGAVQVHSTINLDGKKVASSVTSHQIRSSKKRTLPRGV